MFYRRVNLTLMFRGGNRPRENGVLSNVVSLSGFLTIVLYFGQDRQLEIPLLDVIQTFFCWPSFFEGLATTFCLWSFRHIENILGPQGFVTYLMYNAITYVIPFVFVVTVFGFRVHFSMFNFIPYSLYVFTFWRIPAVMFANPITDKDAISLAMLIVFLGRLPYSFMSLISAIFGYILWCMDALHLRKKFYVQIANQTENG